VCGDPEGATDLERKGAIEALWDIFGGTMTESGFKVLDAKIGLIYGDAITLKRARAILDQLARKGFASCNVVFGIGSYTYQFNTRDSFGFALKSTMCNIKGIETTIFKDPKTDDGLKKSQKGCVAVVELDGRLTVTDGHGLTEKVPGDQLVEIFRDGRLLIDQALASIRARVKGE
jgi:nicotinamide phosphoribosyltransferase